MSISKFSGHMRSIKPNFTATIFENLLRFGGNCAGAPPLTAVWANYKQPNSAMMPSGAKRGKSHEPNSRLVLALHLIG